MCICLCHICIYMLYNLKLNRNFDSSIKKEQKTTIHLSWSKATSMRSRSSQIFITYCLILLMFVTQLSKVCILRLVVFLHLYMHTVVFLAQCFFRSFNSCASLILLKVRHCFILVKAYIIHLILKTTPWGGLLFACDILRMYNFG